MSTRKEELLKELQELETLEAEDPVKKLEKEVNSISEQDMIDYAHKTVQAPKKPRTQKQIEAFNKACETRKVNEAKRKEERIIKELEEKKILEEKLVQQAIAVKKRQIKKAELIDQIAADSNSSAVNAKVEPELNKLTFRFY